MIRHIVLFRFDTDDPEIRSKQAAILRERISSLVGVVPGLIEASIGEDLGDVGSHYDIALVALHQDRAALKIYQTHPAHAEVAQWIQSVASTRAVVDFELTTASEVSLASLAGTTE
jgi:hypothetical protein